MKVLLRFKGLGILDEAQALIKIWNCDTNYYYEGFTYNGELSLELVSDKKYHLRAIYCRNIIDLFFYVEKKREKYVFYFPRFLASKITFYLWDKNYPNMPIKKGVLLLWQNK